MTATSNYPQFYNKTTIPEKKIIHICFYGISILPLLYMIIDMKGKWSQHHIIISKTDLDAVY